MIRTQITGHLGADAELRQTSGGAVLKFRVASTRKRKSGEVTTWLSCSLFGKRAEALQQWLTKGSKVAVAGEFYATEGDDGKMWLNLDVSELDFMGKRDDGARREPSRGAPRGPAPNTQAADFGGGDDSDLPF